MPIEPAPQQARRRLLAVLFSLLVFVAAACSSSDETPVAAAGDPVSPVESQPESENTPAPDADPVADAAADGTDHHHGETLEVAFSPVPSVELEVFADPKSGWNLHVVPTDFRLAPENASTDPIDGEGHMHLYVDGQKITRLYGEWFYLAALDDGDHEIRVELSANDHRALSVDGELIDATTIIAEVGPVPIEDGGDSDAESLSADEGTTEEAPAEETDDATISVAYVGGTLTGGGRQEVAIGEMVTLRVEADVTDHVHVHGYDILTDIAPGTVADITFEANLPGVWEVELEDSGVLLAELQVG